MDKALITAEIEKAMREHDRARLSILRLVKNDIDIKEKEAKRPLTDEEVVVVFKKVLKQTGETLDASEKAGTNEERTALLREQVTILEDYLPQQVSGDELLAVIDRVLAGSGITQKRDMGKAIGLVVTETGGNVDKAEIAMILGPRLA